MIKYQYQLGNLNLLVLAIRAYNNKPPFSSSSSSKVCQNSSSSQLLRINSSHQQERHLRTRYSQECPPQILWLTSLIHSQLHLTTSGARRISVLFHLRFKIASLARTAVSCPHQRSTRFSTCLMPKWSTTVTLPVMLQIIEQLTSKDNSSNSSSISLAWSIHFQKLQAMLILLTNR
jgi:hypothetical protein